MQTTIEVNWYPEDTSILELELNVPYTIEYIRLAIEFKVSKLIPAKLDTVPENCYDAEGGEVEILNVYPMYLTTTDMPNVPVKLIKPMRNIIGNWIVDDAILNIAYKYLENNHD